MTAEHEAAWVQARQFSSAEIARIFGVPLPLVDHRYNPCPFKRLRLFRWLPG